MTVVAALLTSFYSWRLVFKTFHGKPADEHAYEHAHESPLVIVIPADLPGGGPRSCPASRSRSCSPVTRSANSSASR